VRDGMRDEVRNNTEKGAGSLFIFWAIYRSKAIKREISEIESQFQSG
jgi:hypothetical protein